MSAIVAWGISKLPDLIRDAKWFAEWKAWQVEYHAKLKARKPPPPPTPPGPRSGIPPGVMHTLLAFVGTWLSMGASCPRPSDIPDLRVYCCDPGDGHPERCTDAMKLALCTGWTPTPGPVATPSPTPVTPSPPPTRTPTATPTTSPAPTPPCVPDPSDAPVSIRQEPRCRPGFEPIEYQDSSTLCAIKAGTGNSRTAWRLGYGLYRQGMLLAQVNGVWLQFEENHGYVDALGRYYPDGVTIYHHPEGPSAPYTHGGYTVPDFCGATPTPTPPGPVTPTPPPPAIPQPTDFRASFVAACQQLHYTEVVDMNANLWRGRCDSTIRYSGTLRSGEFYRNTSDRDHWVCAIEACPGITPEALGQHQKTYELTGGREWYTPGGTEFHVTGAQKVEVYRQNNYQVWIWGHPGDDIRVYACLPPGAMTDDGILIPVDGRACGGEHPVTFEEPR